MNDQDSMTREQLEAAGYCFSFPEDTFPNDLVFPLQWGHSEHAYVLVWSEEEAYNIATAHYRQQQELAALREFKRIVLQELDEYAINDYATKDSIFDVIRKKAYAWVEKHEFPTKPERTD